MYLLDKNDVLKISEILRTRLESQTFVFVRVKYVGGIPDLASEQQSGNSGLRGMGQCYSGSIRCHPATAGTESRDLLHWLDRRWEVTFHGQSRKVYTTLWVCFLVAYVSVTSIHMRLCVTELIDCIYEIKLAQLTFKHVWNPRLRNANSQNRCLLVYLKN